MLDLANDIRSLNDFKRNLVCLGPTDLEGPRSWRQSLAEDQALDCHPRCDDQKTNRDPRFLSAPSGAVATPDNSRS